MVQTGQVVLAGRVQISGNYVGSIGAAPRPPRSCVPSPRAIQCVPWDWVLTRDGARYRRD
eukprot:3247111-Rhodomonas_salina.2